MGRSYRKLRAKYRLEAENYYHRLDFGRGRQLDDSYALDDDIPLTPEETAAVQEFWGRYRFAYPNIDLKSFQTFKNRSGYFDPRHLPGAVKSHILNFIDHNYTVAFQNKAMLGMLYPDIAQPRTIVRRMNMLYYDEAYRHITLKETIRILMRELRSHDLIFKLNFTSGGHGVFILNKETTTSDSLRQLFTEEHPNDAFVVQELLEQSEFMKAFNPSSVNTVRITTLLFKGTVHCLAAFVRIGSPGNFVDNWCSGGSLLNIDMQTGKCGNWALGNDKRRITLLPSGVDLSCADLTIPNFQAIKDAVVQQHYRIPYIRLISWDIALDTKNTPTMIECNFAGNLQAHEAVNGPFFGDLTQAVCDEYLLNRFFLRFADEHFLFREYHDHVVIEEYLGRKKEEKVTIPTSLHGKPVTAVEPNAFKPSAPLQDIKRLLKKSPFLYRSIRKVWRKVKAVKTHI